MNNFHHIKGSHLICDIMEAYMAISRIPTYQSYGSLGSCCSFLRVTQVTAGNTNALHSTKYGDQNLFWETWCSRAVLQTVSWLIKVSRWFINFQNPNCKSSGPEIADLQASPSQTIDSNKPTAQAEGADPSRWSSTSRQIHPTQQNCCNFWTNTAILMPFKI